MTIKRELLEILACPKCNGTVLLSEKEDGLICRSCGIIYQVRNDIPVMLFDEAVKLP